MSSTTLRLHGSYSRAIASYGFAACTAGIVARDGPRHAALYVAPARCRGGRALGRPPVAARAGALVVRSVLPEGRRSLGYSRAAFGLGSPDIRARSAGSVGEGLDL